MRHRKKLVDKNIPSRPLVCAILGRSFSSVSHVLLKVSTLFPLSKGLHLSLFLLNLVSFHGTAAFCSRLGVIHEMKPSCGHVLGKPTQLLQTWCSNSSPLLPFSRSDGGVYCYSYDEGFSHGFVLVRAHTHTYTHARIDCRFHFMGGPFF